MNMKKILAIIVAVIIAAASYFIEEVLLKKDKTSQQTTTEAPKEVIPPGEYIAKVERIADGDTITVRLEDGRLAKLRLLWIDTPEKNEGYKLLRDVEKCGTSKRRMKEAGEKATAYAKRNFHKGDKVKVKIEGQGHFKRYLALIWNKEGELYNEEIIKDGYACIYRKAKYPKYLEDLLEDAKENRRGLWKDYYDIMECLCYGKEN
ncbi:MAG: thermonuclease family protein [Aquificae bacterium]|nr:thermonuclease family protein [Aquificota bacterium]